MSEAEVGAGRWGRRLETMDLETSAYYVFSHRHNK